MLRSRTQKFLFSMLVLCNTVEWTVLAYQVPSLFFYRDLSPFNLAFLRNPVLEEVHSLFAGFGFSFPPVAYLYVSEN